MKPLRARVAWLALLSTTLTFAAESPVSDTGSSWVFSLLPKSLQKNPRLDITVITEVTDEGKKLPPPSPDKPAYFAAYSAGLRHLGDAPAARYTVKPEELEKLLIRSLATNGYRPAQPPAHPASLLVIYSWGTHSLLEEGDAENPALSPEKIARNVLDRAALVGGEKFAKQMMDLFQRADALALANRAPPPDPTGGDIPPIAPILGPEQLDFMNPVHQFKMRSPKNEFLVEQAASDVYYVVASAYDYAAAAKNEKRLLWRTRMTVAAQGVSHEQSLPTLVLAAAPYFGREMPEPEILSKRPVREGTVEVGTPTVVESKP